MNRLRPTNILAYHRLSSEGPDPFSISVDPECFTRHLEVLKRVTKIVTLDQLGLIEPSQRTVLTFDDGYADNLHVLLPIAEKFEAPITVFVTSGILEDGRGFWWDRLAQLILQQTDPQAMLDIEIGGSPLKIRLRGAGCWELTLFAIHRRLRGLDPTAIETELKALEETFGSTSCRYDVPAPLTAEEIRLLSSHPLVTIGCHTVDHPLLSVLSATKQWAEIYKSKAALEATIGIPVRHFAYPFGGLDSYTPETVKLVAQARFLTACTTLDGRVSSIAPALQLPRRAVGNWDETAFESRLRLWDIL